MLMSRVAMSTAPKRTTPKRDTPPRRNRDHEHIGALLWAYRRALIRRASEGGARGRI